MTTAAGTPISPGPKPYAWRAPPHPLHRPVRISLWGNPEQVFDLSRGTHLQARARRYFDANPNAEYCLDQATHAQLGGMNRRNVFNGSLDHPPSHATNTHSYAEIAGPGPHGLILKRDWHPSSAGQCLPPEPAPAGVLIVPNAPVDRWFKDPEEREFVSRFLWTAWEQAVGKQHPAVQPVRDVLSALAHTLAAHKLG